MAIPASKIVSINPRLISAGGRDLAINGLLLSESSLIPLSNIALTFATADDVANYFGADSVEYKVAVKYFLGYNNSFSKPRDFIVAKRVKESEAAWLRSKPFTGKLESLKTISDGSLSLEIDGVVVNATGINLSSDTSFSNVAQTIQTAIASTVSGVSVTFSSLNNSFTITSPTVGSESSITYAVPAETGIDLATMLGLTENSGAVISQGSDSVTVAENFRRVRLLTDNWVTFTTAWQATPEEALEYAQWAGDQGVDYLYVCWSRDKMILGTGESVASALEEGNVGATAAVFGDVEHAAFIMACAASINWNRLNGTINFAFKSQDGLVSTVDGASDASKLNEKRWSYYGTHATRNDQFTFLYDGQMYGAYRYIDPYINAVWFKNVLQVSIMNGLTMAGRVPYNDLGYTMIRAWCIDPINRALYNGVINVGVTVSESQKAQMLQETGVDISEELFRNGYYLQVAEPSASIRATRESPDVYLYYTYGGSVNKITVASTVVM